MMRLTFLSLLFVTVASTAHAQGAEVADAADELRILTEERPLEIARLPIGGAQVEIQYVVDDAGMAIYQGDIVLGDADTLAALADGGGLSLQSLEDAGLELHGLVANKESSRWPEGRVPYLIDDSLPGDWVKRVEDAVAHWEAETDIRFARLEKPDGQYILFFDDPGQESCQSPIGRQASGPTRIQVAGWCKTGNLIHEIGHALGLHHEQARFDRDRFIEIKFAETASDTMRRQFRQDPANFDDLGPYCYDSIMHYPKTAKDPKTKEVIFTISARAEPMGEAAGDPARIGQRDGLAACDIETITQHYAGTVDDVPMEDIPAMAEQSSQDIVGMSGFEGDLVLYPAGCAAAGRCLLRNDLFFTDPFGLVWKADRRATGAAETVMSGTTDGASIPDWAQGFIGEPFDPSYLKAAVIHDHYMYKENRVRGWWKVQRVFYDMLKDQGVPIDKAQIMYLAVLVGSSKWITPRPDDGTYCGPGCLNDLAEREGFERIDGQVYRVWPESYGTAAYDAAMERGIAVLRERGEEMTLGDVNQLARTLLSEHPVFIVGDSVTLNSAHDVELLAR